MTNREQYIEDMVKGYAACAAWLSEAAEDGYTAADFHSSALDGIHTVCADFFDSNSSDLSDMTGEQAGHDFYLTRNHHGAGFWDRGLGERGDRLTANAHPYGEAVAYVGDDLYLYMS